MDDGGRFSFREMFEVILTRDTWMRRVDVAWATGRDMVVTPQHDGRIVEDCVLDWAKKHGRPFSLSLGGPAGGRYEAGTDGPLIEIDNRVRPRPQWPRRSRRDLGDAHRLLTAAGDT
jgi:hypothetical protein